MRAKTIREKYVEALVGVMKQEGVSVEALRTRAPRGFWAKVAEITGQGRGAASMYWFQNKEEIFLEVEARLRNVATSATVDNLDSHEDDDVQQIPPPIPETVTHDELERMMQDMEDRLTAMIERRLNDAFAQPPPSQSATVDNLDMPPMPPKTGAAGKRFAGRKGDLRARVDANLLGLLEDEARRLHSGNMSRCLDTVLWKYFGKPVLSFQDSEHQGES